MGQLRLFDLPVSKHTDDAVSRAGSLYGVHAYHTKVPPEAIEPHIARHSGPAQLVIDPFCGSGMTGVAARRLGRRAFLSDLSPAAVHIASNYGRVCDPIAFRTAADHVATHIRDERQSLYGTTCHQCHGAAITEYVIWSDLRACPRCDAPLLVWNSRGGSLRRLECGACGAVCAKSDAPLRGETAVRVNIGCANCGRIERDPTPADVAAMAWTRADVPGWFPSVPFGPDREMWRRGHSDLGIATVADFYSPRNLWALAILRRTVESEPDDRVRAALHFAFTAIANRASRRYQWNAKRPTNVLGGTLYIASLRYEFNVFSLWERKVRAVSKLFAATLHDTGHADAVQASAVALPLQSESVDYCFTDPPFGANIVYSDCSLLWEAWLGRLTDRREEAVVNRHHKPVDGGKDLPAYASLMAAAFLEIRRVLRRSAAATLVFQNTDPVVWDAIQQGVRDAGFAVEDAATLHKSQPSFKGIKGATEGERVAASDVILTLRVDRKVVAASTTGDPWQTVWTAIGRELERVGGGADRRRSTGHLYAVALAAAMAAALPTNDITFDRLEAGLRERYDFLDGWTIKEQVNVAS